MEGHFCCTCTRDRGKDTGAAYSYQEERCANTEGTGSKGGTPFQKGGISHRHSWAQKRERVTEPGSRGNPRLERGQLASPALPPTPHWHFNLMLFPSYTWLISLEKEEKK